METLYDLPSPYEPHACGLLHLPRFLAKIRKHLKGELPKAYERNFTRGFDGFLCLHLGIEPKAVIALVEQYGARSEALKDTLKQLFPKELNVHIWNRQLVQMGMSPMGRETLERDKQTLGLTHFKNIFSYADLIEADEGRLKPS